MMQLKPAVYATAFTLVLAACGGSDSSSSGDESSSAGDVSSSQRVTEDLNGIYQGSFTEDGSTFDLTGLIQDGRVIAISSEADTIYDGTIDTTNSGFSGDVGVYENRGSLVNDASLEGTFERRDFLNGSFNLESDSGGTFSLDYDSIYERDSSLSQLTDVWSFSDGGFTVSISIDPDGTLMGSDTAGCVYSGSTSIIDPSANIYSIDFAASSCQDFNGDYSGFVTLADQTQANDTMIVAGSNENFLFVYSFTRQ